MNEIKQNSLKALAIAIIITLPIMVLFDDLVQDQRNRYLEKNNCYNENVACDLFPFHYLLIPIPLIIYYISFNYFEKKRKKTWKSYR